MELIYLWVEEYKNIKQQGFNFSPRFKCEFKAEYDENNKLKDNCELIIEKKEYKSIFPENINITAIVGENGSGKSSILELLPYSQGVKEANKLSFLLFKKDNEFILLKPVSKKIQTNKLLYEKIIEENIKYFDFSDNYSIKRIIYDTDFTKENFSDKDILKYFENNIKYGFSFKEQYLEKNNKIFNLKKYKHISNWLIYFLIKDLMELNGFFNPNYIKISNQNRSITNLAIEDTIKDLEKIRNAEIKSDEKENINKLIHKLEENQFLKTLNYNQKIFINDLDNIEILFELPIQDYFYIDFYNEKDVSFSELSQGERNFYIHFLFLIYLNKNHSNSKENENTFFLIDEPDTTFHPNWQKKYIRNLINIFKNYKKTIHFIITSHSPFLLSDLPKENIIFLEKGVPKQPFKENEQTFGANIHTLLSHGFFMSDGLMGEFAKSKIEEIKKFYELIQKLQKKGKIKNKNLWKKSYERRKIGFENIQKIIGEPFLQTIIKNYLDDLHLIFSDDETLINKELDELEKRKKYLEKLKNDKN